MTNEKIDRVTAIVTNFLSDMKKEKVTNYEFAEAISSMIIALSHGSMKHEDRFIELISQMVKSMSLINPKLYEEEK